MHPVAMLTGRESTDGVHKEIQLTVKFPKAVQLPALDDVVCLQTEPAFRQQPCAHVNRIRQKLTARLLTSCEKHVV
eukprot:201349-Pleurochrysis_carterae.AAC.1